MNGTNTLNRLEQIENPPIYACAEGVRYVCLASDSEAYKQLHKTMMAGESSFTVITAASFGAMVGDELVDPRTDVVQARLPVYSIRPGSAIAAARVMLRPAKLDALRVMQMKHQMQSNFEISSYAASVGFALQKGVIGSMDEAKADDASKLQGPVI